RTELVPIFQLPHLSLSYEPRRRLGELQRPLADCGHDLVGNLLVSVVLVDRLLGQLVTLLVPALLPFCGRQCHGRSLLVTERWWLVPEHCVADFSTEYCGAAALRDFSPVFVRYGSWLCKNSSARATGRNLFDQLHL